MKRRADDLADELAAAEPASGRMLARRIPGTVALAVTNLMGAGLLIDNAEFELNPLHAVARAFLPAEAWGALFTVAGVCLTVAVFTRRLIWLNVGSTVSLFAWIAVSLSLMAVWLAGDVTLTPLAGALLMWMVAGQASMLFTPLLGRGRGPS